MKTIPLTFLWTRRRALPRRQVLRRALVLLLLRARPSLSHPPKPITVAVRNVPPTFGIMMPMDIRAVNALNIYKHPRAETWTRRLRVKSLPINILYNVDWIDVTHSRVIVGLIGRSPYGRQPLSRVNCDPCQADQ